ncbi:CD276 antigen-like [Trachinotus anak]|uniref:CD276 antigen-like n=1 Tax=Trachinotus anak TaxID=443729 RepID=UPI0039F24E5A
MHHQMWKTPLEQTWTAALYLGLVLSHLVGEGSVVKVLCQPGERVTLLCSYHYEDHTNVSQLSVQWRSPHNELLCHYIKHKAFQNCTAGYTIIYAPGNITLTIQQVRMEDFGVHVCSVSKRHEFSDYSIELARMSESVTSAPKSRGSQSGHTWTLILLHTLALFVCM